MSAEIVTGKLGHQLDQYLSRITPFGFSGAFLLAKDGKIVLNKGYGLANRAKGVGNTAVTVFSLGSITKQFTAAAIMKLEMLGKLHTTDPLTQFFPDVPTDKAAITLHQLLTHTAGLLNYTGEDYEMADKEETILKILESELLFPPGTAYDYSNAGYTLLAAIVEQAAQQPYEQFLQEQLFAPARMYCTGYRLPDWSGQTVAHWYAGSNDFGTPLEKTYPSWNLMGNGDMLSTTEDMFRWHTALLGNGILSEAAKQKMYTPELREYGYGWRVVEMEHGRCIQHNGASSYGSSALFRRFVDADVVIMLFCNQDYSGEVLITAVQDQLEARTFGDNLPLPPKLSAVPPHRLAEFTGSYILPGGGAVQISVENEALQLTPTTQEGINWLLGLDAGETAVYNQIYSQTKSIMTAALAGNTEPLLASLANRDARTAGVLRTWQGVVEAVQPESMEVLGIRPSLYLENACEAITKLTGPEESSYFISIWRDGQNVGVLLTELTEDNIFTLIAQPVAPNQLVTYHLTHTQSRRFRVLYEGGSVTGLISEQNIVSKRK